MYQVYISRVPDLELDRKVRQVLRENGFQCEDWQWRNTASDAEIHKALKEADVYLCYSSDEVNSQYEKRETDMALYNDAAVIAVRLCASDRMCGGWAMVDLPAGVGVFDLEDESSLADLPGFIKERIRKNARGDLGDQYTEENTPEKPYEGEENYLFISFADEDRPQAYRMIKEMQSDGFRIWYDNGRIKGNRERAVSGKIGGCSCLIALVSPRYTASESCKEEIGLAKERNRNRMLVYLEKTKLPPGLAMRLHKLPALHRYDYPEKQAFYDQLYAEKEIAAARR